MKTNTKIGAFQRAQRARQSGSKVMTYTQGNQFSGMEAAMQREERRNRIRGK